MKPHSLTALAICLFHVSPIHATLPYRIPDWRAKREMPIEEIAKSLSSKTSTGQASKLPVGTATSSLKSSSSAGRDHSSYAALSLQTPTSVSMSPSFPEPTMSHSSLTAAKSFTVTVTITETSYTSLHSEMPLLPPSQSYSASPIINSHQSTPTAKAPVATQKVPIPSPYIVDAIIDGSKYNVPSPGEQPITLLLTDGSSATLSSAGLQHNGAMIKFPTTITKVTEISSGSFHLSVEPGHYTKPQSGHGGGLNDLKAILSRLQGPAGSVATQMASIAGTGKQWAAGGPDSLLTGMEKSLDSALNELAPMISQLNGLWVDYQSYELDMLSKQEVSWVFSTLTQCRQAHNFCTSIRKIVRSFNKKEKSAIETVKKEWVTWSGSNGILVIVQVTMETFKSSNWSPPPAVSPYPHPSATSVGKKPSMTTKVSPKPPKKTCRCWDE